MEPYTRLLSFILELRKTILYLFGSLIFGTFFYYFFSQQLFDIIQNYLQQDLVFYSVAGPFLAHMKLSLGAALMTLMPALVFCIWFALAKPFKLGKKAVFWFVIFTCILFYAGAIFCYSVTLPYGIKFLLSFSSEQIKPVISVGKFVSFVAIFILAFGVIFELPIFMVFSAKTGLISRVTFEKNRRYAVLAISIIAALLTPTPDIVNMMLMGVPLYTLYELGIIVLKILRIN